MPQPDLRAGDTDREAVAASLGAHMAAGRLTVAEYEERLTKVYAARTFGDLAQLTTDLPADWSTAHPAPVAEARPAAPPPGTAVCGPPRTLPAAAPVPWGRHGSHAEKSFRAWAATSVIVLLVYLFVSLSTGPTYFWPMWVIGPWGAALLARNIRGGGRGSERGPRQLDR